MPMLNVFMSIIPLLLLSASFMQVAVIQATLPADVAADTQTPVDPLDLTVVILHDAYLIRGQGRTIAAIPRTVDDGARAQLAEALARIVAAHPENQEVRIVAQPTTHYEDIVKVMDVAREAGLPGAALADVL